MDRKISVNRFALITGFKISHTSIFRWFNDTYRPSPETMKMVCETLTRLPVVDGDGNQKFEEVYWSEGLRQYVPKAKGAAARKYGRSR
jgi:hypothetical protein